MNREEIWTQLTERHHKWADPDHICKLTARGMKALLDQAFNEGYAVGAHNTKVIQGLRDRSAEHDAKIPHPFDQIFRNKP
jgi:hypothetical protein